MGLVAERNMNGEYMTGDFMQTVVSGSFPEGLAHDTGKRVALLTKKLVGQAIEENKNVIWSWLMNDEVLSIGIYGMGGVGKIALVMHIHNQILKRPDIFHDVCWITVTVDCDIYKLQNLIAKEIDIDLSNESNEDRRAARLYKALIMKQRSVLILDDLWHHFPPQKVGIPVKVNGCKFIFTTRSLEVCQKMGCHEKIKVEPLSEKEAWALFMEKLGHESFRPELEQIAKSVARECDGLPLGIMTMVGSMREVNDECEWRNALEELKEAKVRTCDMEPQVFSKLRLSYSRLKDGALQKCFLYCALFPEDYKIQREVLIEYLIIEGIIEMGSMQEEFDKGHDMLNKLENVCLLESEMGRDVFENFRCIKMHDLIRDMALQLGGSLVMVEDGKKLKKLPKKKKWTKDLVVVSLMENDIKDIPSCDSPSCPNLSTILLCGNYNLVSIADTYFQQLCQLKLLDVSHTKVDVLPGSLSDLVSLTALLLRGCKELRNVPSLSKLVALKKLDLTSTGIEELPKGMEFLSNLTYLNLHGTKLNQFPADILPSLSNLQLLNLRQALGGSITVKAEEIAGYELWYVHKLTGNQFHKYEEYTRRR